MRFDLNEYEITRSKEELGYWLLGIAVEKSNLLRMMTLSIYTGKIAYFITIKPKTF